MIFGHRSTVLVFFRATNEIGAKSDKIMIFGHRSTVLVFFRATNELGAKSDYCTAAVLYKTTPHEKHRSKKKGYSP